MKLFVIVVTYNGMQWYDKCFNSIKNSTVQSHLVVIDNASSDDTINYIRNSHPGIHLITNSSNLGFGMANNIGIEYAVANGCDYVYLLNQDAWVEKDTFEVLINLAKKYPEYGIISPIHINSQKNALDKNFQIYISNTTYVSDLVLNEICSEIYDCDFFNAAHWLITKKCLETVGLFSPVFPHYGEDENYTHRIWYHGFKAGFTHLTKCVHAREGRVETNKKLFYMNYVDFLVKSCNINKQKNYLYLSLFFWIKNLYFSMKCHDILALRYVLKPFIMFSSIRKNNKISKITKTCIKKRP